MVALTIRAGAQDRALLETLLPRNVSRPSRIVVDAHVAAAEPGLERAARAAGVPFIVDPQTHFLQDVQHAGDPWARLAFADPGVWTPSDCVRQRVERLVERVVDHQLATGATVIVPPYVHVDREDDDWLPVQLALWRATRRQLDDQGIGLPVLAVLALGWRLLDRTSWPSAVGPLRRGLDELGADEAAIAASKVDAGAQPQERLASFLAVVRALARARPVVAWQQGTLGEAAVAAGAVGYECGIGWRERCDLRSAMTTRRKPAAGGGPRPVYVDALQRGVPRASVQALLQDARATSRMVCMDITCCPVGRQALLSDARAHAVQSRARALETLGRPAHPSWQWQLLAERARTGLELAARIDILARSNAQVRRVDTAALRATFLVAEHQRQNLRRRRAA